MMEPSLKWELMPIDSIPCNFIATAKCRFLSFSKSKNYYDFWNSISKIRCTMQTVYINELCHTLIMQRYENDKNMKFWEFFESKKCFVFYNFRNRCKSRGSWCILNQLKVLAPSSRTVRHVLLNWTVLFSKKLAISYYNAKVKIKY